MRRWHRVGVRRNDTDAGRDELLGRTLTVVASSDPNLMGVTGEILDETMKTLVVRTDDGRQIVLAKAAVTLRVELDRGPAVIEGRSIMYRPEDRVKKVR